MKQLMALKTATSSLGGKCVQAGIEQDRYSLVENTVPFDMRNFENSNQNFWSNETCHKNDTFVVLRLVFMSGT